MTMSFPMVVIASDLSPNTDIIINRKNGFLFECTNAKDLAHKIDALVNGDYNLQEIKNPELIRLGLSSFI